MSVYFSYENHFWHHWLVEFIRFAAVIFAKCYVATFVVAIDIFHLEMFWKLMVA